MVKVVILRATDKAEEMVAAAARGDYAKKPPWHMTDEEVMAPIKGVDHDEKVENFLKYLMNAGHWGPWEHVTITFGIEQMSRVTLAQLTRHRLASFDIQSQRYVRMKPRFAIPPNITAESIVSRKGGKRESTLTPSQRLELYDTAIESSYSTYKLLVDAGIPEEDARYVLPEATMIHGTMTVNARSLMHIIALRSFGDAQWEIRELAEQLLALAKEWMPITFNHFEKRMKKRDVIAP